VIDSKNQPKGVMPLAAALQLAQQEDLDLIEIAPNANPPVCKVLDFGKYRYELAKKEKESKKNTASTKVKELKFHVNIDEHDYLTKLRFAENFMWKGMKVKILMAFRGREMMHQELGMDLIKRIRADLAGIGVADAEPKLIGRNINMMLTPLPVRKRVRKFTREEEVFEEEDNSAESLDNSGEENHRPKS
jgi:translation initiation factor IF-3